jgi:hypothetical protein
MIVKLISLDASGQSYASLKLVEFNIGSILKGFYFGQNRDIPINLVSIDSDQRASSTEIAFVG